MMRTETMEISGWGCYPRGRSKVARPERISDAMPSVEGRMIARGQGRSYGDAAMLKDGLVMLTDRLNREQSFDEKTGLLTAEAGTTLAQVIRTYLPRGWFPAVVPGTQFVSLGGCIAADIHGKNHHRDGAFGANVKEIEIVLADGTRTRCSPEQDSELFWATIGGMGLTGIITEVTFKLIPIESPGMVVQHHQAKDLDGSLNLLADSGSDDRYTVAWIDCLAKRRSLGRSVLIRGHHAKACDIPLVLQSGVPTKPPRHFELRFDFPSWTLNSLTVAAFNEIYYRSQGRRREPFVSHYDSFFFPLDRVENWNRMYGKRGFVQYQCVLPMSEAERGLQALLEEVAHSHRPSFLSVLKRFGRADSGLLSFPMEGYTLTLDLPVSDPHLFTFLDRLDDIVSKRGGRVYLAKDARLHAETFRAMYPRFVEWQHIKSLVDPEDRFDSDLARRLRITSA